MNANRRRPTMPKATTWKQRSGKAEEGPCASNTGAAERVRTGTARRNAPARSRGQFQWGVSVAPHVPRECTFTGGSQAAVQPRMNP
jgi:hypothetical protein